MNPKEITIKMDLSCYTIHVQQSDTSEFVLLRLPVFIPNGILPESQ